MSVGYELAYRFGITPWERAGTEAKEQFEEFLDREKSPSPHPRAVDLGCGRGTHAVQLAECGWAVTGVDQVPRAIQAARRLAVAANQEISFVEGDVTNLPDIGAGFQFVLDVGCFHGLSRSQRGQFGQQVDSITDIGRDDADAGVRAGWAWAVAARCGSGRPDHRVAALVDHRSAGSRHVGHAGTASFAGSASLSPAQELIPSPERAVSASGAA